MIHEAHPHQLAHADRVACRAYAEYGREFPEWVPYLARGVPMTELAREAKILVAHRGGAIAGAVGYVAPQLRKHEVFPREWAALRFMAVDPDHRRQGVARALAEECGRLPKADGAQVLGLLTGPAIVTAFPLYLKIGFTRQGAIAPRIGMPAEVLALRLAP